MKKLFSLLFLTLGLLTANAQSVAPGCATRTYKDDVNARTDINEQQKAALLDAFDVAQQEFNKLISISPDKSADTTLVIPVVFHIIHAYGPENIPNKTIHATINLLNREYSKTNYPVNTVVFPFKNWIGNVNLEFRLATVDPDGNCTNGIIRYVDRELSYCQSIECNQRAKAKYRWPREKYMNCHIVGSIESSGGGVVQGFSHFPFPPYSLEDSIDANAMIFSVLPTELNDQGGNNTSVTSHEVGHWLGLYHTWGKSDNAAAPENCNEDDDVFDTPNCVGLPSVCNLQSNSCGAGAPNDTIDNTQNFMDYSHCYAMFTEGQAARMRGVLLNVPHRKNLPTQANLIATGTNYTAPPTDLCKADFTANLNYEELALCPGQPITFSDLSFHSVTSRKWTFEGADPVIGTDSIETVTYSLPGTYSVTLEVKNGNTTEVVTKQKIIRVIAPNALGGTFNQDFETIDLTTSTDFEVNNKEGDVTFEVSEQAGYMSSKSVRIRNFLTPAKGRVDELITNTTDVTGISNLTLDFKYAFCTLADSVGSDELNIYVSTNCGLTWMKRKIIKGNTLKTALGQDTEFAPTDAEWKSTSINLQQFAGKNLRIKFEFTSGGGNDLYIDKINLYGFLGVDELNFVQSLELQPNPSTDQTSLAFDLIKSEQMNIQLMDLTGRLVSTVFSGQLQAGESKVDIPTSHISPGVYLVVLDNGTSRVSRKLIVQ